MVISVKVLLGLCGEGFGHSSRQSALVESLLAEGDRVQILTSGRGVSYFSEHYPDVPVHAVHVPWVETGPGGVRWLATINRNRLDLPRGLWENAATLRALEYDGYDADVCVSDYDPIVAWYARLTGRPLVTVDQASKFLGFVTPRLWSVSREEERSRLGLFLPSARYRLATAFRSMEFPKDPRYDVQIIPPLVRPEIQALVGRDPIGDGSVVVYLSGYSNGSSPLNADQLVTLLEAHTDRVFNVYGVDHNRSPRSHAEHVNFKPTSRREFVADLERASAVISTAGHTLISEAITLSLPVLALSLFSYDQHFCAWSVADLGIGMGLPYRADITQAHLTEFFERLPDFRKVLETSPRVLRPSSDTLALIRAKLREAAGCGPNPD